MGTDMGLQGLVVAMFEKRHPSRTFHTMKESHEQRHRGVKENGRRGTV